MVSSHLETFQKKVVKEYDPSIAIVDPDQVVYRIKVDYDDSVSISEKLEAFACDPHAGMVTALIIGSFATEVYETGDSAAVVAKLVELKDTFKELKALFFGDITFEECEISWIQHGDVSPILKAYPKLEYFQIRGGEGLTFSELRHDELKTLIVETGGLPPNVISEVSGAHLPNLERLDLWMGSENYGFASAIEDFSSLLSGRQFPKLVHLGLMNSEIQDELAIAVTQAPVLQQLKVLDLSMGTLTDKGGEALLNSEGIRKLTFLNLRHHFLSTDMMEQLKKSGIPVNVDDQETAEEEDYRFAEVTE